jgi:hypothetical protein
MPLTQEEAHARFEEELKKEIYYDNREYQATLEDDDPPPNRDLIIQRHVAILRMLFHVLATYRGAAPFGPISQAEQKHPELWKGVSYEEEFKKISEELNVPYPEYPEDIR